MAGNRFRWLSLLLGLGAYRMLSGTWASRLALLAAALLPVLSLVLSLPAILGFSIAPTGAEEVRMGNRAELWLLGSCPHPMPPFRGGIRLQSCFTGEKMRYPAEKGMKTAHCGGFLAQVEKAYVCDYLGLFAFRVRHPGCAEVRVFPPEVPVPDAVLPETGAQNRRADSEDDDLRPYRPGDPVNRLHRKLCAKTGRLILRQPVQPDEKTAALTLTLSGTPDTLDRKLGQLLWLGKALLSQETAFCVYARTGCGMLHLPVASESALHDALGRLLCCPTVSESQNDAIAVQADWQYHIGGQPDAQ